MFEFFRQLTTGIRQAWGRLTLSARVQIGLAAALTLAVIVVVVLVGARPQYGRLYTRLDPSEVTEIATLLADSDIPYRLREGGTAIDVPISDIAQARVMLAGQNLPRTQGVVPGFELFDNRDLMSSRFLQDVDYMRALKGELQRTLNQFNFVRNSHVFIRESPEQLFVSEEQPSQATVTLDTTGPLTPAQVKAVVHTVSSFGGANLAPQSIAITDTEGNVLHSPAGDTFASLANDKLEYQVALESQRERDLRAAFRGIGVEAIVNVSAILDWTQIDKQERVVTEGAEVSLEQTSRTTQNIELPPEGAPGAVANIPEELGRPGGTGLSENEDSLIINNDPSESFTRTTTEPGVVKQFKVAAFIEGTYSTVTNEDGTESTEYQALTEEEITRYSQFIANAVGDGELPTEVAVFDQPFNIDRIAVAGGPPAGFGAPWYASDWLRFGVQGVLIVLALFAIRWLMRRALILPTTEEEEMVELPEISPGERRRQEIAAEVERLSQEEPEVVAALLRNWMAED